MEVDKQLVAALEGRIVALQAANEALLQAASGATGAAGAGKVSMPKRLILVRHGESEGNVDQEIYKSTADNALHLTAAGWKQAIGAGKRMKAIIGDESTYFITSPYARTRETFNGLAQSFGGVDSLNWSEDPRLREQDFGNYQDPEKMKAWKKERKDFGTFYYRYPSGESPADVFDRVSSFMESLHRMWSEHPTRADNYVLVIHGMTIQCFLMRWFKYSVDEFSSTANFTLIATQEYAPTSHLPMISLCFMQALRVLARQYCPPSVPWTFLSCSWDVLVLIVVGVVPIRWLSLPM
jgi:broad specificity phosphatase PhoE